GCDGSGATEGWASSAEYLICPQQHRLGYRYAYCLGCLHVDDKLELRGLLDGKLCRVCALQEPVNILGCVSVDAQDVGRVAQQETGLGKFSYGRSYWQAVLEGEGRQEGSVNISDRAPDQKDGIYPVFSHRWKYSLVLVGGARFEDFDPDSNACSNGRKGIR